MAADFTPLPEELASLRQFCVRVGKRPFVYKGKSKTSFSGEWQDSLNERLTFSEAWEALQKPATVYHEEAYRPVDGIGFLVERSREDIKKPLGGDLDCCRDPVTGELSAWSEAFLQKIQPFRTEVSLSKCGIRFFVWGHLLDKQDSVFGNGPQEDLPEVTRERILTAKPKAREKLAKGDPVFNGLELYEDNRHLTLTGEVLVEYCYPPEDRSEAISQALVPFIVADALDEMAEHLKKSSGGKLQKLNILDVIDTSGFVRSGGQLFGSHPTEHSTTGRNLVVDTSRDIWAYMHNKPAKGAPGGDAWTWLACECGAVQWERAGPGVLKDAKVMRQTLEHAVKRRLVSSDILGSGASKADRSILDGLSDKIKDDPGIIYEPEYFQVLTEIYNTNPKEWVRIKKIFLTHKVSVKDFVKEIREAEEDTPLIETPFMEFEGGKLAEMVANNGIARFAVYDPARTKIEYFSEIMQDGTKILPPTSDEIFQKGYVTLPSEAEEYGTELDLYREIQKFVHRYLEVSPDYESIASFYPMLTWVHDVMPVIAYLRAKGDWGVGKSRYLDVFRALCYRSISTTGAMSEAPIFRIMDRWKGTLIIDEGDFGKSRDSMAAMEKILVCGFERGKPIIRCNPNDPAEVNFFDPFGPKIIATRYGFRDKALESRCFTEIMKESIRTDVPVQLPSEFEEEARYLRNKLLMYRFRNRDQVKQTSEKGKIEIDLSGLPKRIQQAARPLSVILANYPELLVTLKAFLVVKSKALVAEASETTEGYLVRVMESQPQLSNDGKNVTWDTGFGSITELIKAASGNYKLTTAMVRSRANSLGFKTEKSMIAGEQKRRITCEVPLFTRLVARHVPQVDDVDDLDDTQGDPTKTLSIPTKPEEDDKTARERELSSGGDIDRPHRPDCPAQPPTIVVAKSPIFDDGEQFGKMGKIDRKTPAYKEDPGFANFKVGMAKRKCYLCGRTFPYDLTPYYDKGASGHICVSCHMGGKPPEPAKADPQTQTKLEDGEAKA